MNGRLARSFPSPLKRCLIVLFFVRLCTLQYLEMNCTPLNNNKKKKGSTTGKSPTSSLESAIPLNNSGVSLMMAARHGDAVNVLRKSLIVDKEHYERGLKLLKNQEGLLPPSAALSSDIHMHLALTLPISKKSSHSSLSNTASSSVFVYEKALMLHDSQPLSVSQLLPKLQRKQQHQVKHQLLLERIRTMSAVSLFNMGLAYHQRSKQDSTLNTKRQRRNAAEQMYICALEVVLPKHTHSAMKNGSDAVVSDRGSTLLVVLLAAANNLAVIVGSSDENTNNGDTNNSKRIVTLFRLVLKLLSDHQALQVASLNFISAQEWKGVLSNIGKALVILQRQIHKDTIQGLATLSTAATAAAMMNSAPAGSMTTNSLCPVAVRSTTNPFSPSATAGSMTTNSLCPVAVRSTTNPFSPSAESSSNTSCGIPSTAQQQLQPLSPSQVQLMALRILTGAALHNGCFSK
mmetsp:Transcript_25387/g.44637  ORF Transcript_25387/g.44637 Transcript_25387/m.44637 type:complete len:460 (+) Transcript_25387:160-1539(+)